MIPLLLHPSLCPQIKEHCKGKNRLCCTQGLSSANKGKECKEPGTSRKGKNYSYTRFFLIIYKVGKESLDLLREHFASFNLQLNVLYRVCHKDIWLKKNREKGQRDYGRKPRSCRWCGAMWWDHRYQGVRTGTCRLIGWRRLWDQRETQVLGAQGETETNGHSLWQPAENRFCQTSLISFFVESASLTEKLLNKCSTEQLCYVTVQLESNTSSQKQ